MWSEKQYKAITEECYPPKQKYISQEKIDKLTESEK